MSGSTGCIAFCCWLARFDPSFDTSSLSHLDVRPGEDSDEETEDSDLSRAKDSESEEEAEMPAEEAG